MSIFYFAYGVGSWILLPIITLTAWSIGGRPERAAAGMYVAAMVATLLLRSRNAYIHPEVAVLTVDFLLLVGLVVLALTADRFWPMPSAAFQALSCLAHVHKLVEPRSYTVGYQLLAEASTYPALILLAVGVWRARCRRVNSTC